MKRTKPPTTVTNSDEALAGLAEAAAGQSKPGQNPSKPTSKAPGANQLTSERQTDKLMSSESPTAGERTPATKKDVEKEVE